MKPYIPNLHELVVSIRVFFILVPGVKSVALGSFLVFGFFFSNVLHRRALEAIILELCPNHSVCPKALGRAEFLLNCGHR